MQDCGSLIEREIARQRVKKNELATFLNISPQNFSKLLHKQSIDSAILEKICEYLNMDPMIFFDFRPNGHGSLVGEVTQNNTLSTGQINLDTHNTAMFERLIEEKQARIEALQSNIASLERTINILLGKTANSQDE